jgi:beta-1,4-N-acetylglucosaminyltransferase
MKAAYMIISHAGSGSILEALSLDKKLLIVINSSLMDNHQSELANELCPDYLISTHITNLMSNFINCYNRTPCKKWDSAEYTLLPIIKEELGL